MKTRLAAAGGQDYGLIKAQLDNAVAKLSADLKARDAAIKDMEETARRNIRPSLEQRPRSAAGRISTRLKQGATTRSASRRKS